MRGTFRNGDQLSISVVSFDSLRLGDVVVFHFRNKTIAHRIVGRDSNGLITRGDSNPRRDAGILTSEKFVGKIWECERGGRRVAITGGVRGLLRSRFLHAASHLRRISFSILTPLYRLMRATHLARLFWHPRILKLKLCTPADGSATEGCIKYLVRGRTAACWFPAEQRWLCRKPYDLVLDAPTGR